MSKQGQGHRRKIAARLAFAALALTLAHVRVPPALAQSPPAPPSTSTDDRARSLDALFKGLKSARGDDEAEVLVARIWEVWTSSGRADVDQKMQDGIGYLSLRQLGAAHARFTEAIEVAPDFAEAWNKRATVLYLLNEHEQSLADIEQTLLLEPRHFGALAGRGMIHAHAGRWKEALEAYSQALAVNPFLKERTIVIPELQRRAGEKPL